MGLGGAISQAIRNGPVPARRCLTRFSVIYLGLVLALALVVYLSGHTPNGSLNIPIILVSVLSVTIPFARTNFRAFTLAEYLWLLIGAIVVDSVFQLVGALPAMGSELFSSTNVRAFCFVLAGHALLFAIGFSQYAVRQWIPARS